MPDTDRSPLVPRVTDIPNSAGLLKLIRDHPGMTFRKLSERVGVSGYFAEAYVQAPVEGLIQAGLVGQDARGRLSVGERYRELRRLFPGLSLTALADDRGGLRVVPFLGVPEPLRQPLDVFVLMPFAKSFSGLWTRHIRPLGKRMGLRFARADDFMAGGHVMSDVWQGICGARLILADISGANPNVFYELGLAHAIGKPVLLITRDPPDTAIPFDLVSLRHLRYADTPQGVVQLLAELRGAIRSILGDEEA